jgi:uncharacterized protein (DUF1330 family)
MAAYMIVDTAVSDPAAYEKYKVAAAPLLSQHGARYLVRGGTHEVLEGAWQPHRLVLLEFPTREQALAFWHSPEYAAASQHRLTSASLDVVLVEGT